MCPLEESEREHINTIRYVEEDEKEYSVTMCNSEVGDITIESATTDHKYRNRNLWEKSSYLMNQDYYSYDKIYLVLNVFLFIKKINSSFVGGGPF